MPLEPVADVGAYFARPAGRVLVRDRFLCSSPDGALFALFAWGRLGPRDFDQLREVFEASPRHVRRDQLVDLTRVDSVSPVALARMMAYYTAQPDYLRAIAREALVRPDGVAGVLAEGFYPVVPLPFEGRVFRTLGDALVWLSPRPDETWREAVGSTLRDAMASPRTSVAVERRVREGGARLTVLDAARALGMSRRTLQRRLAEEGTTFERLRARTLVGEAERLLGETDEDIKWVSFELGFRTPARFAEIFRREVGVSPSEYRSRRGI
ncbi:MAG TPA: hypothetical protein DEF51_23800 [Myxococcales bacterium]|nr:hypothetical protein [Myxococcales bacterium]